ncbi:MAG: hypothetical protein QF440_01195 [Candidatus Thalassarchaeaceae archaeon]|nr:hypothetical protein [Candidatus Thalassarchaeaceae archaeon]
MASTNIGGSRLPAPVKRGEDWVVLGGTANRLWERGYFGRPIRDGIQLTAAEVLNAHRLRGMPLPYDGWLADTLTSNPNLLFEAEVLGALRYPGEKVILSQNIASANAVLLDEDSWALRWPRDVKPSETEPVAEVRWMRARDAIDWEVLARWTSNVESGGRIPEILIVDDEHGVVTYRCKHHNPRGEQKNPFNDLDNDARRKVAHAWSSGHETSGGYWLNIQSGEWPITGSGINLEDGVWIDHLEARAVSRIVNPTMLRPEGVEGTLLHILEDLLSRGLTIRPGFKYGTRWRAYDGLVGDGHAPWLIVPIHEAPTDWAEACLSARLSAGVNKKWLCALPSTKTQSPSDSRPGSGGWRFLALERPPSDARWTNPIKH